MSILTIILLVVFYFVFMGFIGWVSYGAPKVDIPYSNDDEDTMGIII